MERIRSSKPKRNHTMIDVDTNISDKSVNNSDFSSGSRTSSMRKPLSDLINFNLIPTQTLRKLCSNSISPSEAQSLLLKSQAPVFPSSQPPSDFKPRHNISESDSRSPTSIGSSNFNAASHAPNTPTTVPLNTSLSKDPNPIGENGSKIGTSNHQWIVENLQGQKKTDVSSKTSSIAKKTKNQEKVTPVHLSSTLSEKAKDKGKAVAAPFDSTSAGKERDKGKSIAAPFDSIPTGNIRDKGKETSVSFRSSNVESTCDKEKAIYVPFTSTLVEKTKDKGKAVGHEESEDIETSTPMLMNSRPSKKLKDNRKADDILLSCPPHLLATRNTGNELNQAGDIIVSKSWTDPPRKAKKKKRSQRQSFLESSLPEEYVKQQKAYFEEVDAFELPVQEVSVYDSD